MTSERVAKLGKEIMEEVAENGEYSVSIAAELVVELDELLTGSGFEVSYPGQSETQDGVVYEAIHVERANA